LGHHLKYLQEGRKNKENEEEENELEAERRRERRRKRRWRRRGWTPAADSLARAPLLPTINAMYAPDGVK
jgi:hypothetical protein